jgi:hypothetical protein
MSLLLPKIVRIRGFFYIKTQGILKNKKKRAKEGQKKGKKESEAGRIRTERY